MRRMLAGMADTTTTAAAPERLIITEARAIFLRELLRQPRKPQYATGVSETLGMPTPSVRNMMYRFHEAGWLVSTMGPRTRYQARRYFTLTSYGLRQARAEMENWEFTDE